MNDRILDAFLKDFQKQYGLEDQEEWKAFELFANHSIISKFDIDGFEPSQVAVGGGGDLGLDGIGILVDNHLVFSSEGVNYFIENLRRLDVEFVFVQAKTSPHFDGADIGTFISGVRRFFESSVPAANDEVVNFHQLKEQIFDASIHMSSSPVCKLFYVTTGQWNNDADLVNRIKQGIDDLESTNLFSSVEFIPIDLKGIQDAYRDLSNKVMREFVFERHTVLPEIAGVRESYIGIVPCQEYLKLICDDDGNLNRRLFYDNVRDFQGENTVNREIEATIRSSEDSDHFGLLNNGVTIVARDLNRVGVTFRLGDYQVVNGCQTSHILQRNRNEISPNIFLPLKLIVTDDEELTNQITRGTNSQTEVQREAFESMTPFHKNLEEYYLAMGRDLKEPIFYERRSKQYDHLGLKKNRIITLPLQIACFTAMFLNEPQSTHRYYGELLSSNRDRIFKENHKAIPYYVSGLALATLEQLVSDGLLPRSAKTNKYQLLMVLRIQTKGTDRPNFINKQIEEYCKDLLDILNDESACISAFNRAFKLVEDIKNSMPRSRDPLERTRAFTTALTEASTGKSSTSDTSAVSQIDELPRSNGTVNWYDDERGYGFITGADGINYFVHHSQVIDLDLGIPIAEQSVEFAILQTNRGYQAMRVRRTTE